MVNQIAVAQRSGSDSGSEARGVLEEYGCGLDMYDWCLAMPQQAPSELEKLFVPAVTPRAIDRITSALESNIESTLKAMSDDLKPFVTAYKRNALIVRDLSSRLRTQVWLLLLVVAVVVSGRCELLLLLSLFSLFSFESSRC